MKGNAKKVFVGMSGGVDSSVSAALLKQAGYDVTGVFIKVWHPEWLPCEWKEERRDAMRVAAALDIPFLTFDLEAEYKKGVVDYMLDEYRHGRTPNPDVMCNKEIKFGSFFAKAREMGADFIATGHYAQNAFNTLVEGKDKNKDQSYFLWTIKKADMPYVLFPVGGLQKKDVRALAAKFKLPVAEKKDSQGICFIGKVDMKDFLSHYIDEKQGNVLNETGEIIGTHRGVWFYTVGERHGFTITEKTNNDKPYFVVSKNIEANTITVSHRNTTVLHVCNQVRLKDMNEISEIPQHVPLTARYRYRQIPVECTVDGNNVFFIKAQEYIPTGQSLVIYKNETCLGGGIIEAVGLKDKV